MQAGRSDRDTSVRPRRAQKDMWEGALPLGSQRGATTRCDTGL